MTRLVLLLMHYTQKTEIRAHREPWLCDTIALRVAHITTRDGVRSVALAEPLQMKVRTEAELYCELPPTIQLRPDEAQQLMDELWRVGMRPTEGTGSAGAMAATERHLNDMRRLVFDGKENTQAEPR